jgi:Tfp pilus assembly protein PilN
VIPTLTRLALIPAGNRLVVAALQGGRAQTFVVEADQPAAALRAELDARHIRARTVAIGLARSAVTVKPVDFPLLDGDLREMVRFELERHLPFPADDAAFDFLPLRRGAAGPGGEARRVLVAGADRRMVDGVLRVADEARLRATSVTVAAHDLPGLVRLDGKQRVVWVHRSPLGSDLLFLAGGELVLSRTSGSTGDEELAAEIRRSFTVLRWRACDGIWLSGERELAGTALLALNAAVSAPPYTPRAARLLAAPGDAPPGLAELAIAVAARRGARPLDLVPAERRPRRLTRAQWVTVGMLAITLAVGLAALLHPGYRASRQLAKTNRRIEALTPQVRAVEGVQRELERKRKLLASIEALEANALRPLPVIRELTDLVPPDAWLTALSLDAKGVELTGQAGAASALIPLLENSSRLERVEFSSPVTRGRDKEQFRIKAAWEIPGSRPAAAAPEAPAAAPPRGPARPGGRGGANGAAPARGDGGPRG